MLSRGSVRYLPTGGIQRTEVDVAESSVGVPSFWTILRCLSDQALESKPRLWIDQRMQFSLAVSGKQLMNSANLDNDCVVGAVRERTTVEQHETRRFDDVLIEVKACRDTGSAANAVFDSSFNNSFVPV